MRHLTSTVDNLPLELPMTNVCLNIQYMHIVIVGSNLIMLFFLRAYIYIYISLKQKERGRRDSWKKKLSNGDKSAEGPQVPQLFTLRRTFMNDSWFKGLGGFLVIGRCDLDVSHTSKAAPHAPASSQKAGGALTTAITPQSKELFSAPSQWLHKPSNLYYLRPDKEL